MRVLQMYERSLCGGCGWSAHAIETETIHVETAVCPVCAEADRVSRVAAHDAEASRGEKPSPKRQDPADGRRVVTRKT